MLTTRFIALLWRYSRLLGSWDSPYAYIRTILASLNTVVIKRQAVFGRKSASEPGVHGNLPVLLSQDRWIQIRGLVDDLKLVTSEQWLREQTTTEGFASALATLLVYVAAANASTVRSLLIAILLLISAAL
jgi:hypothetical protein